MLAYTVLFHAVLIKQKPINSLQSSLLFSSLLFSSTEFHSISVNAILFYFILFYSIQSILFVINIFTFCVRDSTVAYMLWILDLSDSKNLFVFIPSRFPWFSAEGLSRNAFSHLDRNSIKTCESKWNIERRITREFSNNEGQVGQYDITTLSSADVTKLSRSRLKNTKHCSNSKAKKTLWFLMIGERYETDHLFLYKNELVAHMSSHEMPYRCIETW